MSKNVLIVEDDDLSFFLLKEFFEYQNINIIHAKNGVEAINICRKDIGIDLILMDIMLPDINGIEVTQVVKKARKDVKIIAHTALVMKDEKEKCLNAGCDDFIGKPVDLVYFSKKISQYLDLN